MDQRIKRNNSLVHHSGIFLLGLWLQIWRCLQYLCGTLFAALYLQHIGDSEIDSRLSLQPPKATKASKSHNNHKVYENTSAESGYGL